MQFVEVTVASIDVPRDGVLGGGASARGRLSRHGDEVDGVRLAVLSADTCSSSDIRCMRSMVLTTILSNQSIAAWPY